MNAEGDQSRIHISRSAEFCEQDGWRRVHGNPDILLDSLDVSDDEEGEVQEPERVPSPVTPRAVRHEVKSEPTSPTSSPEVTRRRSKSLSEISDTKSDSDVGKSEGVPDVVLRRSARTTKGKPPERFTATSVWACMAQCEPESFEEVQRLPPEEASKWQEAMEKELNSMRSLGVYSTTPLPEGKRAVGSRWVYRLKPTISGEPQYKARLVARGFTQQKGLHFTEVYAPTSRSESLRMLLASAAQRGFTVQHFDIDVAYLNANLEEELYMLPPPGFEEEGTNLVWKLHKSIYGLRQSARNWNLYLNNVLEKMGFQKSLADSCLYLKGSQEQQELLLVFVDDIIFLARSQKQVQKFAKELGKYFKHKNLGPVKNYLGVQVDRIEDGSFMLSQEGKIEQILEKFRMSDCKGTRTPMEASFIKDSQVGDKAVFESPEVFQSALGSLLYLSQWTRPDIAFAVNLLSREASEPSVHAWNGIKRVLRYLHDTKDFRLKLSAQGEPKLTCYTDSDWANLEDRKSVSGSVVKFGNSLIGWRSKKQSLIALSSTEAEFSALSDLCREVEFYKCLVQEIYGVCDLPIVILEDNQPCLKLAESAQFKARTKHLDIRFKNVCQSVQSGLVKLSYCPSTENLADGFTKPLTFQRHEEFCKGLSLV